MIGYRRFYLRQRQTPDSNLILEHSQEFLHRAELHTPDQPTNPCRTRPYRRALRPHRPNQVEPAFQPFPEFSRAGILRASELPHETEIAEQRNALSAFCHEAPVRETHEQIERRRGTGKRLRRLHIRRDRMAHDLLKELVTEYDFILEATGQGRLVGLPRIPDARFAHKVESGVMNHHGPFALGSGPEKR